jgi:carbamoylphosphate synthase large subunit
MGEEESHNRAIEGQIRDEQNIPSIVRDVTGQWGTGSGACWNYERAPDDET